MELPYQFPDPIEEAARRADEFRRLPPDERLRELVALMELGLATAETSLRRHSIQQRFLEQESQWQSSQRELFAGHG